jgi:FkbM family methyltransferase
MVGGAFVGTVHDRLTVHEGLLHQLGSQLDTLKTVTNDLCLHNHSLAESQTALLQGVIRVIESLQNSHKLAVGQTDLLVRLETAARELQANMDHTEEFINSGVASLQSSLQRIEHSFGSGTKALGELQSYISEFADHAATTLKDELVQQVCVETTDYSLTNPEIGLISFLYSYLPTRRILDIGAHVGQFSEALISTGYEVYAFEPSPAMYEELVRRLGTRNGFHPFQFALGSTEGQMALHSAIDMTSSKVYGDASVFSSLRLHGMPDGLQFTDTTTVQVRMLNTLHLEGLIPKDIGLVKIDTEGFDLEVIRGMREFRYPVVSAEYWDADIPFSKDGLLYTLESLVSEMRSRSYLWHLVLYRIWGRNQIGYYCNHDRPVPNSWGNIFFFTDYAVFAQAQLWCSAVLPRIYFKPALAAAVETGA